jgi:hypothetical protein
MRENLKKNQKHVVEYKNLFGGVVKKAHLCTDNLNNLFALETNTY